MPCFDSSWGCVYTTNMIKKSLIFLVLVILCGSTVSAFAWDKQPLHDRLVEIFKDIEAVFSWHMDDRKTLKEVGEETARGILS